MLLELPCDLSCCCSRVTLQHSETGKSSSFTRQLRFGEHFDRSVWWAAYVEGQPGCRLAVASFISLWKQITASECHYRALKFMWYRGSVLPHVSSTASTASCVTSCLIHSAVSHHPSLYAHFLVVFFLHRSGLRKHQGHFPCSNSESYYFFFKGSCFALRTIAATLTCCPRWSSSVNEPLAWYLAHPLLCKSSRQWFHHQDHSKITCFQGPKT